MKIWTHHSSVSSQITRLTDGQTDGRMDGQNSHRIGKPGLHSMQRGKNRHDRKNVQAYTVGIQAC